MAAETLDDPNIQSHLKLQMDYTNKYYNWNKQGRVWTNFLTGAINAKQ